MKLVIMSKALAGNARKQVRKQKRETDKWEDWQEEHDRRANHRRRVPIRKAERGLPVGTVREWKGRQFKKIAPGKWQEAKRPMAQARELVKDRQRAQGYIKAEIQNAFRDLGLTRTHLSKEEWNRIAERHTKTATTLMKQGKSWKDAAEFAGERAYKEATKIAKRDWPKLTAGKSAAFLRKAKKLPIGTVRDWQGRKFKKVGEGKWRPVKAEGRKEVRGAPETALRTRFASVATRLVDSSINQVRRDVKDSPDIEEPVRLEVDPKGRQKTIDRVTKHGLGLARGRGEKARRRMSVSEAITEVKEAFTQHFDNVFDFTKLISRKTGKRVKWPEIL